VVGTVVGVPFIVVATLVVMTRTGVVITVIIVVGLPLIVVSTIAVMTVIGMVMTVATVVGVPLIVLTILAVITRSGTFGVGVIVVTVCKRVGVPLIVVATAVVITRPGVVVRTIVVVTPPVVNTEGAGVLVMVARTPFPKSLTNVSGGSVVVTRVPPITDSTVMVVGRPGVDTITTVTSLPSAEVVSMLVSAVRPSSGRTTGTVSPPTRPFSVLTTVLGGGEETMVSPTEFVVVSGEKLIVDVILISVVVPLIISLSVFIGGSTVLAQNISFVVRVSSVVRAGRVLMAVGSIPGKALLGWPTSCVLVELRLMLDLVVVLDEGIGGISGPFG